jgi:hypothetical protein
MLNGRPSMAMVFVRPVIAYFDILYGADCGRGTWAEIEPLLMILAVSGQLWGATIAALVL